LKRSIFPNNNSLVPEDSTVSRRTIPTNRCGWASGGIGTTVKLLATGWIEARRPRCKSMHSFCSPIVCVLPCSQKFSYCLYPNTAKMYSKRDGMFYRFAFLFRIIWKSLDLDSRVFEKNFYLIQDFSFNLYLFQKLYDFCKRFYFNE